MLEEVRDLVDLVGCRRCGVCGMGASSRCSGCGDAWYCSRAHQKEDRKAHRKHCVSIEECVERAMERGRSAEWPVEAKVEDAQMRCWVCLESGESDSKLYRGLCGCRGDSGAAHVVCWVDQAFAAFERKKTLDVFDKCPTCRQPFMMGPVQLELHYALWLKIPTTTRLGFSLRDVDREASLRLLGRGLRDSALRRSNDAQGLCDFALDAHLYAEVLRRKRGSEDEAVKILRQVLLVSRRLIDDDDLRSMQAQKSLAEALLNQGDWRTAAIEYKDLTKRANRVLGPENFSSLVYAFDFGRVLIMENRLAEAIDLLRPFLKSANRILGPDHGLTTKAKFMLKAAEKKHLHLLA